MSNSIKLTVEVLQRERIVHSYFCCDGNVGKYSLCRYRMLSRPYAFGCILRLRTSSEFKPGNSVSVPCFGN